MDSIIGDFMAFMPILYAAIETVLEGDVAQEAILALIESIENNVYDKYDPTKYQRRKDGGGLIDPNNFTTEVHSDGDGLILTVKNITEPGYHEPGPYNSPLDDVIERGSPYGWQLSEIAQRQPYPRPFYEPAEKELLDSGRAMTALIRGLEALLPSIVGLDFSIH